ncbi:MAG: response regulator, partial [Spirochaetota bacterium]
MESAGKSILVIDDEKALRESIKDFLEDTGSSAYLAHDGQSGIDAMRQYNPDAAVVDLNMPGMDGFDVVKQLAAEFPETPIIVLSGVGVIEKAIESMRLGAWDFIAKPLSPMEILTMTLDRAFERSRLLKENRRYKEHLEEEVEKKTRQILDLNHELISTQKEIILTLGDVVETRSHETAYHVDRVAEFAYILGTLAGINGQAALDIRVASPMHDVGKIGIPDQILNKPGAFTPEEMAVMKKHTVIGHSIFKNSNLPVLKLAAEIALCHHERWDGKGYPNGIAGNAIPLVARITTIVDVFDAISHK